MEAELGHGLWQESSFYKSLRSDTCQGTATWQNLWRPWHLKQKQDMMQTLGNIGQTTDQLVVKFGDMGEDRIEKDQCVTCMCRIEEFLVVWHCTLSHNTKVRSCLGNPRFGWHSLGSFLRDRISEGSFARMCFLSRTLNVRCFSSLFFPCNH